MRLSRISIATKATCAWGVAACLLFALPMIPARGGEAPTHVNVASACWGTTARASSQWRESTCAEEAIDGAWARPDHDKWASGNGGPHWLMLDFGTQRIIDRVLVRHEGARDANLSRYNTADFRLQWADHLEGPWTDLVEPIQGNTKSVTEHAFEPRSVQYLRLYVTQAEQKAGASLPARIYEVEVYAPVSSLRSGHVSAVPVAPPRFRRGADGSREALFRLRVVGLDAKPGAKRLVLGKASAMELGEWDLTADREVWLPLPDGPRQPLSLLAGDAVLLQGFLITAADFRDALPDPFFEGGAVYLVEHSHSDIAWNYTIAGEAAVRNRNLAAVFQQMRKDPNFRWTIECVLFYQNWLAAHPETEAELLEFFRKGRLDCGATYTQPLEDCLYGELLARQMYVGKRWFESRYPGLCLELVTNQDSPMRGHQAQQVYAKAGVRYLKGSRLKTSGYFRWYSPDGSYLTSWFQHGYWGQPRINEQLIRQRVKENAPSMRRQGLPPVLGITWGHDYNNPVDLRGVIDAWNAISSDGPRASYGTFADVLRDVEKRCDELPEVRGGVPNWWIYENWPSHHRALTAQRQAAKSLVAAEMFQSIGCLLRKSFDDYPQESLTTAWTDASYACHTMVPGPAPAPDAAMLAKYEAAAKTGAKARDAALTWIAQRVKPTREGLAMVVFNQLSWQRTEPVFVTVPEGAVLPASVVDDTGSPVSCQRMDDRSICFLAREVPPVGYRTFYGLPDTQPAVDAVPSVGDDWNKPYTSKHYVVTPGHGGLAAIHDRELDCALLATDRWLGGEWVAFHTRARGASESIDFAPHPEVFLDRSRLHEPSWTCVASGPVFVRWQTPLIKSAHSDVQTSVAIYHELKRIDIDVSIHNAGHQGIEQRLLFPLNTASADIAYEVPFGVVHPGRSEPFVFVSKGRFRSPSALPFFPREVQDWVYASVDGAGVTLGTSVGAWAFRDFGEGAETRPVLSPILLADIGNPQRKQYVQPGAYRFAFSLTSHAVGYTNGYRAGIASRNPLRAVVASPVSGADLPTSRGFFSVKDSRALISTIKKAEDDDAVVVRLFDMEGRDGDVHLHCPHKVSRARKTDLLERNGTDLPVAANTIQATVNAYGIETLVFHVD